MTMGLLTRRITKINQPVTGPSPCIESETLRVGSRILYLERPDLGGNCPPARRPDQHKSL
jgi:hypothetical protein